MTEERHTPTSPHELTLDPKTIDVLIANIIPTSKYFEVRFDNLQYQVNEIKEDIKNLEDRMAKRFEQVDKRFEQVDAQFIAVRTEIKDLEDRINKRFEQVDKRFEQVNKRFEQLDSKLDKIIERIDRRIDEGLRENRNQMMRMFTFAMTFSAISMIGLIGKMLQLF
jgi:chromosome segregation ATPase